MGVGALKGPKQTCTKITQQFFLFGNSGLLRFNET